MLPVETRPACHKHWLHCKAQQWQAPTAARCQCQSTTRGYVQRRHSQCARGFTAKAAHRRRPFCCSAVHEPFPYDADDFHRVAMQVLATTVNTATGAQMLGHLILYKEEDVRAQGERGYTQDPAQPNDFRALVLSVGGDTLTGITMLVHANIQMRPMSLDLLWAILERGKAISNREWRLSHVAIVDMRNSTYIGRIFFGDSETGEVVWDADCRPSDACWLALKSKCGIFVSKRVWDECSTPWRELMAWQQQQAGGDVGAGGPGGPKEADRPFTAIRKNDPEPVVRLKRELEVCILEEDYLAAARIRDHPYMQHCKRAWEHRAAGEPEKAIAVEHELADLVQRESEALRDRE